MSAVDLIARASMILRQGEIEVHSLQNIIHELTFYIGDKDNSLGERYEVMTFTYVTVLKVESVITPAGFQKIDLILDNFSTQFDVLH